MTTSTLTLIRCLIFVSLLLPVLGCSNGKHRGPSPTGGQAAPNQSAPPGPQAPGPSGPAGPGLVEQLTGDPDDQVSAQTQQLVADAIKLDEDDDPLNF